MVFKYFHSYSGDVCSLEEDMGTCSEYVLKWKYSKEYQACTQFYYGGCGGNGNRFDTEEECKNACSEPALVQKLDQALR